MGLEIESRPSDSPYVERVWRSRSTGVERMTSVATAHWDLVVWEQRGQVRVGVQGPDARANPAPVPEEPAFLAGPDRLTWVGDGGVARTGPGALATPGPPGARADRALAHGRDHRGPGRRG
jgi:hypothetical protein